MHPMDFAMAQQPCIARLEYTQTKRQRRRERFLARFDHALLRGRLET